MYTCSCDVMNPVSGYPTITFKLGIQEIALAPEYYLWMSRSKKVCNILFTPSNAAEHMSSTWILGDPFLRQYLQVYDLAKR